MRKIGVRLSKKFAIFRLKLLKIISLLKFYWKQCHDNLLLSFKSNQKGTSQKDYLQVKAQIAVKRRAGISIYSTVV